MMDLDHRIVPWDTVRSRAVLVSVLHQDEVTWTRDPSRDILLWPGHTATITAYPHLTNNKGTLPNMVECRSEPFPYMGRQAYSRLTIYKSGGKNLNQTIVQVRLPEHGDADDCREERQLLPDVSAAQPRVRPPHLRPPGGSRTNVYSQG